VSLPVALPDKPVDARMGSSVGRADAATLAVGALTAAVFVFRLTQLHQSLYGDEIFTYQDVVGRSLGAAIRYVHSGPENSPPLFFILAWICSKLGDPSVWIRLPSLLAGTAMIPLLYLLGRATIGRTGGAIGAAIFATSPFSTYYGIEARPYATMALFVVLSTLALVRAARDGSRVWWGVYALTALAAAYSHYTAVFVLGVQALWSLWVCRGRLREPIVANLLVALVYLPWIAEVRGKTLVVIGLLEPLTAHNILVDVLRVIPGYPYASLHAIPTIPGLIVFLLCACVGLAFVIVRLARARSLAGLETRHDRAVLLVLIALAAPVGLFLYSALGTDIWDARDLYSSAPAAALVLGALTAATALPTRAAIVAAILAVLVFGSIRAVSTSYARPQFRTAAEYLDRVAGPADPVLIYPSFLNLDQAIVVQMRRPHRLVDYVRGRWPSPPHGGVVYAIIDDVIDRTFKIGVPHPPGVELVVHRHYPGLVPFSLLGYRSS
jgi:mannosyltransferase